MPKIEEHLQKLLKEVAENGQLSGKPGGSDDVSSEALQQLIQREFRAAMAS
jgi:hypothetical protein